MAINLEKIVREAAMDVLTQVLSPKAAKGLADQLGKKIAPEVAKAASLAVQEALIGKKVKKSPNRATATADAKADQATRPPRPARPAIRPAPKKASTRRRPTAKPES